MRRTIPLPAFALSLLALGFLLIPALPAGAAPGDPGLIPRPPVIKPAQSVVPPGYDPSRIEVKFVDDMDVQLDVSGIPMDRGLRGLNTAQAVTVLNTIAASGGIWNRSMGTPEAVVDRMRATAQTNLGRAVADLNNYFFLRVPAGEDAAAWMDQLNALPSVELASPVPLPMPAPLPGDYESLQGYLDDATAGIGARTMWMLPGGTGSNVTISDLEYSWNLNHHDLPAVTTRVIPGETPHDSYNDNNHGTAVLGEMGSLNNGWGTTGAVYGAALEVTPTNFDSGYNPSGAVTEAASHLGAGDVIIIEQQIAGPNFPGGSTQFGLVPLEWWKSVYDAIVVAVGNGIHVAAAAGNGSQDLDDPVYSTGNGGHWPFLPANDSGAIIVGAGAAPGAYGGSDTDRSRLGFSCFGSRVNLQGWGEQVMTTGYGYYYDAEGVDYWYRRGFGGTSSATPIVTSAVAAVESFHEATVGGVVTPAAMRTLLINTGSAQQSGTNPVTEHIGPRPNALTAACSFDGVPPDITCPSDVVAECSGSGGVPASEVAAFLNGASATDNVDPNPVITNDAPAFFNVGTTTVTFTATDACGNSASCTADVQVVDTLPPVIYCPADTTVECSAFGGTAKSEFTAWLDQASAGDLCDGPLTVTNDAPTLFPVGTTTVTFTAVDNSGNTAICQALVTVEDTTPPNIMVEVTPDCLWPPNHKMAEIEATVTVTDVCDPNPIFLLVSIHSSEPANDKGDGNTDVDIEDASYLTDDTMFSLRSERQGGGDGRVYTIIYAGVDAHGNAAFDTAYVRVPHDRGGGAICATGFALTGTSLDESAPSYTLVIPSTDGFDAASVIPVQAYVGNLTKVVKPDYHLLTEVTGDGLVDLVLMYDGEAVRRAAAVSSDLGGDPTKVKANPKPIPVGLHYRTVDGTDYLVRDILGLGEPITITTLLPWGMGNGPGAPEDPGDTGTDPTTAQEPGTLVLPASGPVVVEVFNVLGQRVRTLVNEDLSAGAHRITWDGRDGAGRVMPSGMYFYRIQAPGLREVKKVFVVR
jgi:serine protease